jgi:predicted nucleic acid-binding protein
LKPFELPAVDAGRRRRISFHRPPEDFPCGHPSEALSFGGDSPASRRRTGQPKRPPEVQAFIAKPPDWLSIRTPSKLEIIQGLDLGECAAINLARELRADLLLIDETKGREAAAAWHIPVARTASVMFDAANAGVLPDLEAAFNKLKATNFRVPHKILNDLLKEHRRIISK